MYQALYRKYRPNTFDSVVGQNSIIKTLKNSVETGSFSHAYMFFGPRGVGKTTISKILARTVNCLSPKNGECCGKCSNCITSSQKDCVDIIEMDAASNNGVDEIRELKSNVMLVPSELKYKVYIIDEVHMLSIGAFNALLKTLEEPPKHVMFILATTDPQKVPETIVSRCQCFSFKRVLDNDLVSRLRHICDEEKVKIDDDVLKEIAISSEGGVRDALGALDKLISFKKDNITIDDFFELNDMITLSELRKFISFIFSSDISSLLSCINNYYVSGKNLVQVLSQVMYYLRNMLVDYYTNGQDVTYDIEQITKLISLINEKMFDMKKSGNPKIYIEMMLLNFVDSIGISKKQIISREINSNKDSDVSETILKTGDKNESTANFENNVVEISGFSNDNLLVEDFDGKNDETICKILNIDEIIKVRVNNTLAQADKAILKIEQKGFELLNDYTFDQQIGYIVCALLDGKLRAASRDNVIISYDYDSVVSKNLEIIDKIEDVYNKITNSNKKIAIISDDDWEKERENYIKVIKSGGSYTVVSEPKEVLEDLRKDDIIKSEAIDLFGDIVEFE